MKIFLLSFTLFLSAYLWATSFTLTNENTAAVPVATSRSLPCEDDDDDDSSGSDYSECVKSLGDFCGIFTNFSSDQCFEKSVNACHNNIEADCVKDMAIYCDYNTSFSNQQCWEKAVNACDGNPAAMREISESAKKKSIAELKKLEL